MTEFPINQDDPAAKTVGRRQAVRDPLRYGLALQKTLNVLQRTSGRGLCPKGVFRFRTHEEADAWMEKMLARYQGPKT